jgi:hypothetical protein
MVCLTGNKAVSQREYRGALKEYSVAATQLGLASVLQADQSTSATLERLMSRTACNAALAAMYMKDHQVSGHWPPAPCESEASHPNLQLADCMLWPVIYLIDPSQQHHAMSHRVLGSLMPFVSSTRLCAARAAGSDQCQPCPQTHPFC